MQAFGTYINEDTIKQIADLMVTKGLRDAGYVYLGLDGAHGQLIRLDALTTALRKGV